MINNDILAKAREVYGNKNQVMVCIEELNELACVLAKYPRYDSENTARIELHDKVVDEVADVEIILEHVKAIMQLNQSEIEARKEAKIDRLNRWLKTGKTQQVTTEDREVGKVSVEPPCSKCTGKSPSICMACHMESSITGRFPFFKDNNR